MLSIQMPYYVVNHLRFRLFLRRTWFGEALLIKQAGWIICYIPLRLTQALCLCFKMAY